MDSTRLTARWRPREAWQQPVLRFADTAVDTAVGVAVGVVAGWVGLRVIRAGARPPVGKQDNPAG